MSIGTPLGFANAAGSGNSQPATATLPSGIQDGDLGLIVVGINFGPTAVITAPTGWTQLDTTDNGLNTGHLALFAKVMTAAESGTTVSATISTTGRWGLGGVIIPGAASSIDVKTVVNIASSATPSYPSITPTGSNELLIALIHQAFTGSVGTTVSGAWSELAEATTTNPSGNKFGAWVAVDQLTGGGGSSQAGPAPTKASAGTTTGWLIAVAPAASPASGSASGTLALGGAANGITTRSGSASGGAALAGSASGTTAHSGAASGTMPLAGAANGTTTRSGSGSGSLTLTGGASGVTARTGSASGTLTAAGAASGTVSRTGTAAGGFALTGSAVGAVPVGGSASGSISLSGVASGAALRNGTASGALALAGLASGAVTRAGSAAGALALAGIASGASARSGAANGTFSLVGAAQGVRGLVSASVSRTALVQPETRSSISTAEARQASAASETRTAEAAQ